MKILFLLLFALLQFSSGTSAQIIKTIAGNGGINYSGDGVAAISANLHIPESVCVGGMGDVYIADRLNNCIRKINAQTGIITTIAGNGIAGFSGDNGPAINAKLNSPTDVFLAGSYIYIADAGNNRIRKINDQGIISTIAGNGTAGYSGDNGLATNAQLNSPWAIHADYFSSMILIADKFNNRIRKINNAGIITTIAGIGTAGFSGDNGPATSAQLNNPSAICWDAMGAIYIADAGNNRIRKFNGLGIISTFAGNGTPGYSGDNGIATNASLKYPSDIIYDGTSKNIYIADADNARIRKVNSTATITTVAGNGTFGFAGDCGPAINASLSYPSGIFMDGYGNLFIADKGNNRIRKIYFTCITTTPSITISSNTTGAVCSGTPITFKAMVSNTGGSPSYQWKINGINAGTSSTTFVANTLAGIITNTLVNGDIVSCVITRTEDCDCNAPPKATSNSISVLINPVPRKPVITVEGNSTSLCPGASAVLTTSISRGIQWFKDGVSISGATNATLTATQAGSYTVKASNSFGCSSVSNTITITISNPAPPSISPNPGGSTTICDNGHIVFSTTASGSYQWYLNNSPIAGATGQTHDTKIAGVYSVKIINANGCAATSLPSTLIVNQAPTVTLNGSSCVGGKLTLTTSTPVTNVQWLINGVPINNPDYGWNSNAITVAGGNGQGNQSNQLQYPKSLFVDANENIFIADCNNHRVQKWASGATTGITVAGGNGQGYQSNQLDAPSGVYVDAGGNIFIADGGHNHRVQKWTPGATAGITVAGGNGQGNQSNQLNNPNGVFVDGGGNIFIADGSNHRIQKWTPGATTGITVAGGNLRGKQSNQLDFPNELFVDAGGIIFIADVHNLRIQKWKSGAITGITVAGGNGLGNQSNQLVYPTSVFADGSGNIFICDGSNHRIQKFVKKNSIIHPNQAGVYTALATIGGCAVTSNPITVLPMPAKPTITRTGNSLIASNASSYQWYGDILDNCTIISNATGQSFTPATPGKYRVVVIQNGCTSPISEPFLFQ